MTGGVGGWGGNGGPAGPGDVVHEAMNQGMDLVYATVSFSLAGEFIENLTLVGGGDINVTGNRLNNLISGNSGNNVIDGGYGADLMAGGFGDDTYYVDNSNDVVLELAGGGTDLVKSSVSFTLGDNIENLKLTGTGNIFGFGNGLDNQIRGNDGNNMINGGQGNDLLWGKGGADVFQFDTGSGMDTIEDFSSGEGDRIDIHAYSQGGYYSEWITQVGADVQIDLGGGNVITVLNANSQNVEAHIIW